ncbi:MAG: MobC family plasmid mobilization relaxosome protein [bacterium]|nr:MobC family plasmid mobilization relaxosome protein [bacterium]
MTISLRLKPEERERLEKDAAGRSMSDHIRIRLFADDVTPRRTRSKFPVKDHRALSEALGKLGQMRLASNLNQIAKAANSGSLILTPEIEAVIVEACADIREIKTQILKALGL